MKIQTSTQHNKGFTLIELLVVIVIIGILAAIFSPAITNTGIREGAIAESIKTTGDKLVTNWKQIIIATGVSKDPVDSPFFLHASHDLLDVFAVGAVAVSAANLDWYNTDGPSTMGELTVATAPTATTAGAYLVAERFPISINTYTAGTGKLLIDVKTVPSAVVSELVDKMDQTSVFDADTADTTGRVQYDAADANGEHTVTLEYYIK